MDYYLNIKLLPDPEFKETLLMNSVFRKLHRALCDLNSNDIGVSFPGYGTTLGSILRLHSAAERLTELNKLNWLGGLVGYCLVSEICKIPEQTQYRTVRRIQPPKSQAKLSRLLNRGSINTNEANAYLETMQQQFIKMPYIELVSHTNGQKHRRFIELGPIQPNETLGNFDTFGLSRTATIPWF